MAKVIFLSRLYYPHVGGVEKHLKKLSVILSKKHQITIITEQHDASLPLVENYPEAKVYRIPVSNCSERTKKWAIWSWIWRNRNLFSEADVVHIHDVFFWVLPVLPFKILHPKRYFITFHGYEGANPPHLKQVIWHKLGELLTSGNICIGQFYSKWYFTKADVVSFGACDIPFKSVAKTNKAIFVGRLDHDTGIMEYLKAAKELKLKLDVYGEGPLLTQAREFVKVTKTEVVFHGFDPNAAEYISKYKYAFISRYLGILESLSSKTMVFAHYDSEIKYDYLSNSPFSDWIFIGKNSQEIASSVLQYQKYPKRYQLSLDKGYNWAKEQTWAKLAQDYENLWQK